jgi:ATP-dependent RNA helicase DeaD
MSVGDRELLVKPEKEKPVRSKAGAGKRKERSAVQPHEPRQHREPGKPGPRKPQSRPPASDMERFRIEVGKQHDVKPGNIVGAIANEAGLDGQHIGHIDIHEDYSLVDLPKGMPKAVFQDLGKTRVCGQPLKISRLEQPLKKQQAGRKVKKRKQPDRQIN